MILNYFIFFYKKKEKKIQLLLLSKFVTVGTKMKLLDG